jgi:hypothetical protein
MHGAFDHLEDLSPLDAPSAPTAQEQRFPCQRCGGSGRYRGVRIHQQEETCFSCGGRGWFKKPYAHAMADKAAAKAKREDGVRAARHNRQEAFEKAHPGLQAWMSRQEWSSFLQDMLERIRTPAGLSEKQLAAVLATKAKSEARKAEKTAARTSAADLSKIEAMFDVARSNGLKKLAYRAQGLVISPAPAHGTNPGALYVKARGGEYLGKVAGGQFIAARACTDEHKATLAKVAANPGEEARQYGMKTGECCCCGRELTDPESIKRGIGPICEEKWGL